MIVLWLVMTLKQIGRSNSRHQCNAGCGAWLAGARGAALAAGMSALLPAFAAQERYHFAIDAQAIETAINVLSARTNCQFIYTDPAIAATTTRDVNGEMTVAEALALMLANTGVQFQYLNANTVRLYRTKTTHTTPTRVGVAPMHQRQSENIGMEEVGVVAARERQSSLLSSPHAATLGILDARDLKERSINNFQDLGLAVPGMSVQDTGGLHRRVFVRGVGNWAGSSSLIGIYVDEATVTANPAFQLDLRPYDLERIEVLRGAQNGVYGDGSVGGTIRFITKKPQLQRFEAKAEVSAAFTRGGEPGQKLQGVLNLPIVADTFGLRIAAIVDRSGGWIDQPAAQRRDFNEQTANTVYVKGLWRAAEAVSVQALALLHRNTVASDIGEDAHGNYEQVFDLLTYPTIDDRYNLYNFNVSWDGKRFQLVSSSTYLDAFKRSVHLGNRDPVLPPPALPMQKLLVDYPTDTRVFNQELRLASNSAGPWQWMVGGFFRDAAVDQFGLSQYQPPGEAQPLSFFFQGVESTRSWSLFADAERAVSDRLGLGVGIKYYRDSRDFFDGSTYQSGVFDSVNPRFYANFEVTPALALYANVVKGFRSGGFNFLGVKPYRPDSLWNYELGAKTALADDSLRAEVTLFYSDYRDYQVINTLPPPTPPLFVLSNVGDGQIKGLDGSVVWQPRQTLRFGLSGNYVATEFVRINAAATTHVVGDRLDLVPKYGVTLSASYHFTIRQRPAFVRLDYDRQGRSVLRNRSKGGHYHGSSDVIDMLGLQTEWQWCDKFSVGLFVKNLLNDRGYVDAFALIARASRPRPRTVGIKLAMEF